MLTRFTFIMLRRLRDDEGAATAEYVIATIVLRLRVSRAGEARLRTDTPGLIARVTVAEQTRIDDSSDADSLGLRDSLGQAHHHITQHRHANVENLDNLAPC